MSTAAIADSRLTDSSFLRACRGEQGDHTPVWFMRQAGRSLPEYRKLREGVAMLDCCLRSDMIVEITMQPVRRHGVDAAILFSDIVLPLKAAGVDLDIVGGVGPVIAEPVRDQAAVDRLPILQPAHVAPVTDAVTALTQELGGTPLIGFAGAPFTLASYLIEGGPSRDHRKTKALMYGDEGLWHSLAGRLADLSLTFLQAQVAAGASAIQLFDSWAGSLSAADYERYVLPHSSRVFAGLGDIPKIHFGVDTGELLPLMAAPGVDVIGVDWRVGLDDAAKRLANQGKSVALQGNLDPVSLFAPWPAVVERTRDVLRRAETANGHIFNLGHGVSPDTDPEVLTKLVELVHAETAR